MIEAKKIKIWAEAVCEKVGVSPHEIFPKQIELKEGEFGNLVKLPLGVNLASGKKSVLLDDNFKPIKSKEAIKKKLQFHIKNKDTIPLIKTKQKEIVVKPPEGYVPVSDFDKFFNFVLRNELPAGISKEKKIGSREAGVNNNILKNMGIWFLKKEYSLETLEAEVKPIFDKNGWAFADLKGWFNKAKKGGIKEISHGELKQYCETYAPDLLKLLPKQETDFEIYSDEDLKDYEPPKQRWLIEGQIPKGEIGLLVGKRGGRKSFTGLLQGLCLASGKDCLQDKIPEKKRVLYIDEEMGKPEMKKRVDLLKKGLGIDKQTLDIKFMSYNGIKFEAGNKKYAKLLAFISEYKPDLIIVDCFQRCVYFELDKENQKISELFTDAIRPITEAYGCTWLFIHHMRKSQSQNRPDDPLDEVRGGSELVNYCRFVLMCDKIRHHKQLEEGSEMVVFKALKMSNAVMPSPKVIAFTPEEDSLKVSYEGLPEEVLKGEVQCAGAIKELLLKKDMTTFQTKDILALEKELDFRKTWISKGLKVLVEQGFIEKIKQGHYQIAGASQTKLEVKK